MKECEELLEGERMFSLQITQYPQILETKQHLCLFSNTYKLHAEVKTCFENWLTDRAMQIEKELDPIVGNWRAMQFEVVTHILRTVTSPGYGYTGLYFHPHSQKGAVLENIGCFLNVVLQWIRLQKKCLNLETISL